MEWKNFEFLNGMINGIAMLTATARPIQQFNNSFQSALPNGQIDWIVNADGLRAPGHNPFLEEKWFDGRLLNGRKTIEMKWKLFWWNEAKTALALGGGSQPTNHKTNKFMALNEFVIVLLVLLVASGAATHSHQTSTAIHQLNQHKLKKFSFVESWMELLCWLVWVRMIL